MRNDNKSVLENKILTLNDDIEEKNKIIKSTKEYLLILESENKKINQEFNNYKIDSNKKIKKLKRDYKKVNKNYKKINQKLKKSEIKNENLETEISLIKSTFSWKITKPLRWFKRLF